jgi:membrane peptidoglycan carboxypeptidase
VAADPTRPATGTTLAKLIGVLVVAGVLAAGVALPYIGGLGLLAGNAAGKFLNTRCNWHDTLPPQRTTMYARDGKTVIATLFSQDRVPIPLSKVPKSLQDALIATEDRRFYEHHGVDLRGLFRSAISTSSGDTQGGSTLTMQYVKQVRYYQAGDDPKKQAAAVAVNLQRKMEDAKCALYIENTLHRSKKQILDDYLNIAFFGEHSYGIQTAAETYFNKPAAKLSLAESALLVGLLRAPSAYDPFVYPAAAKARRDEVLQNLVAVGTLSQAAASKVEAQPIALATQSPPQVRQGCANANSSIPNAAFFCEYVVNWLETVNHTKPSDLETGGLNIITTLSPKVQTTAQQRINAYVPATSPMTAVLPVLDTRTGQILAMATSKKFGTGKGETEQPVFTKYTAPGASTYKLFALLTALSTGMPSDWRLTTVGSSGDYQTKNCLTKSKSSNGDANVFYDQTESLASATAKSSNTFYVAIADQFLSCNLQPIVSLMAKLGMNGMRQHSPIDNPDLTYAQNVVANQRAQQLVLGSIPTSPLELAGAYAAVANGGRFTAPNPVLTISRCTKPPCSLSGSYARVNVKHSTPTQVIAPQVAAQAAEILTGDTRYPGTASDAFSNWYGLNSSVIAGKTGTAESNKPGKNAATWFVGMTPDITAAAGIINFDNTSVPSRDLAGQGVGTAYGDFAAKVWEHALEPTIVHQTWSWPDPNAIGAQQVPYLLGMSLGEARTALSQYHMKLVNIGGNSALDLCPSSEPYDTIGYYGPQRANNGATITVCLSSGVKQYIYVPLPPPPPPPSHTTQPPPGGGGGTGTGGGGGGGGGGGSGGGGGGGGGGGNGHGGGPPTHSPGPGGH